MSASLKVDPTMRISWQDPPASNLDCVIVEMSPFIIIPLGEGKEMCEARVDVEQAVAY